MVSLKVFRVDISRGSSVKKMNCYLTTSCQNLTNGGGLSFYLSVSSREAPLLKGGWVLKDASTFSTLLRGQPKKCHEA